MLSPHYEPVCNSYASDCLTLVKFLLLPTLKSMVSLKHINDGELETSSFSNSCSSVVRNSTQSNTCQSYDEAVHNTQRYMRHINTSAVFACDMIVSHYKIPLETVRKDDQ